MPTKKPKKKDTKSSNPLRALVIVLVVTFAILGCIALLRYIFDLQYQQKLLKEDVTFARIETFVDTAKVRLKQEFPEAEWRVESFCREPGVKGGADFYGCYYEVTSLRPITDIAHLRSVAGGIVGSQNAIQGSEPSTYIIDVNNDMVDAACSFTSWQVEAGRHASVMCDARSSTIRYALSNAP